MRNGICKDLKCISRLIKVKSQAQNWPNESVIQMKAHVQNMTNESSIDVLIF